MDSFKILTKLDAFREIISLDVTYPDYTKQQLYDGHVLSFELDNVNKLFNVEVTGINLKLVPDTGITLMVDNVEIDMKFDQWTGVFSVIEQDEVVKLYTLIVNKYPHDVMEFTYKKRVIKSVTDHLTHNDKHNQDQNNIYGNNNKDRENNLLTNIHFNNATAVYHNELEPLLPSVMMPDKNSLNFKKILASYANMVGNMNHDMNSYSNIYDTTNAKGVFVDIFGGIYNMYRKRGESDEDFKFRIRIQSLKRLIPNSIIATQQAIDSLVPPRFDSRGKMTYGFSLKDNTVLDSTGAKEHASSALVGHGSEKEVKTITTLLHEVLPVGVQVTKQIVTLETWEIVKDRFATWQDVLDSDYKW